MTEADWVVCTDLWAMLRHLSGQGGERKWDLVHAAWYRRNWRRLGEDHYRRAAEALERHADGLAPEDEWRLALEAFAGLSPTIFPELAGAYARDLRDVFGNPFAPVSIDPAWLLWEGGAVRNMAEAVYAGRAFDRLPLLGDALEDAGCRDEQVLAHCRGGGDHVPGCFLVDALRGRS